MASATPDPTRTLLQRFGADVPAVLLFVWWWAFALMHAKERLFSDAGYYVFKAICANGPWVEHGRWALVLPELPPLLAYWAHLPMSAVVVAFSIALPLFTTLAYVLLRLRWRVGTAGLITVFPFLASLSAAHFSPLFELYFGMVALSVWWTMPATTRALRIARGILFVLGATSHPSGPFLALVLVLLDRILRPERMPWRSVALWAALAIVSALPGRIAPSTYEQEKMQYLSTLLSQSTGEELFRWFRDYLRYTWGLYWAACLVVLVGLVRIAWLRGWTACIFATGAILGLLGLLFLESPFPSPSRYQEQIQYPLVLVACWTVAALWALDKWTRWAGLALLAVSTGQALHRTYEEGPRFIERIAVMERWIEVAKAEGLPRVQVPTADLTGPLGLDPNWSYAMESILISSGYHGEAITIMPAEYGPTVNAGAGPAPSEFVVWTGVTMPLADLPRPWQQLPEGPYRRPQGRP